MPLSPPAAAQMGAAKPEAMDAGSNLAALARLEQLQQGSRQQQEQRLQQPLRALQPLQPAAQPAASLPHPSRPALQPAASLPQSLQPALQPAGSLPQQMQPAVQPTASPPKPVAPLPQQAQQAGVPLAPTPPEPPVDSLSLADLRQAFFDQPSELPALRARLAELEDLRKQCMFPDGGALWDGLLARLRRYLLLLEREAAEQAPAAESGSAAAPFAARCDLCGRQQAPGTPLHLRRMQLMGVRQHLAVCAACAEARRGTLIPLTPTWQLDPVGGAATAAALFLLTCCCLWVLCKGRVCCTMQRSVAAGYCELGRSCMTRWSMCARFRYSARGVGPLHSAPLPFTAPHRSPGAL